MYHNLLRENKDHRVLALKDFEDHDIEDDLKRQRFVPDKATKRKNWNFSVRNKKKPFAVHAL